MYNIQSFSSLIQACHSDLSNTAATLINGLKIKQQHQWYICGNLALNEGRFPYKSNNSCSEDLEYQVLLKAALLLSIGLVEQPLFLTVGFPNSTYKLFKPKAVEYLSGKHKIEYDASVFGADASDLLTADVAQVDVIPEIVGCTIALRKGPDKIEGKFFVLSCGFGTFESVLSTEEGVVEQTMTGAYGMQYAINIAMELVKKSQPLEYTNPQLFDEAFRKGYIILNRVKIDITQIRKQAIAIYYQEIISPCLRKIINDHNLMRTNRIYICGGGINFTELVDCFENEFKDFAIINIAPEPENLAAKGYALNSLRKAGGNKKAALGIDIGNANTRVANFHV